MWYGYLEMRRDSSQFVKIFLLLLFSFFLKVEQSNKHAYHYHNYKNVGVQI